MKKGLLLILILLVLSASVIAQNDSSQLVPRMTNFMGDNVHIIRVQELSAKLDTQISVLDDKLVELEAKLYELEKIKSSMNTPVQVSTTGFAAQYAQLSAEMQGIKSSVDELKELKQELQQEKPQQQVVVQKDTMAVYIIALLGVNSVLLVALVGFYYTKKPKHHPIKTMHEYIAQCIDSGVDEHEIKHELLKKGWPTKDIERVFKEFK